MLTCSVCGSSIEQVKTQLFRQHPPSLDQWLANVCTSCKKVYCSNCLTLGGPTPCPTCGKPTHPAQRYHLEAIGLSP